MSHIYKHKTSGYYYYRDKDRDDARFFSLRTKERREALRLKKVWDERIRMERANGEVYLSRKSLPLQKAIDKYLAFQQINPKVNKQSSIEHSDGKLKVLLRFTGNVSIKSIHLTRLEEIGQRRIDKDKVSRQTMFGDFKVWRAFFNYCESRGLISHNPLKGYSIPKQIPKQGAAFSDEQLKDLLDYDSASAPWRKWAIRIALGTGFRIRRELPSLMWKNIDDEDIRVETKRSERYVSGLRPFPNYDTLCQVLNEIPRKSDWVFYNQQNPENGLTGWGIYYGLRAALLKCGITGHVPENFRHTFATLHIRAGVPLAIVVADLMGHTDPQVTMLYKDATKIGPVPDHLRPFIVEQYRGYL